MKCLNFAEFSGSYWTSAVTSDIVEPGYSFCPSGERVKNELWAREFPILNENEQCVSLHFEENEPQLSGLVPAPCVSKMPVICQFL